MKEALLILLVLVAFAALTAYRYRRQIMAIFEFWRSVQMIRERSQKRGGELPDEPATRGQLVNCPKCGTWVPETEAIRIGRSTFYCSSECVETTAKRA